MNLSIFLPLVCLTSLLFTTGCRRPTAETETVALQNVEPAEDGAYRLTSPRGELALSVKWEQEHWWIRLTEDDRKPIPWTQVSPFEFSLGQQLMTGDLNADGHPDLIYRFYGGGVGLVADYGHYVVLLSREGGYRLWVVCGHDMPNFGVMTYDGNTVLQIRSVIHNDLDTYWVETLLRVEGDALIRAPDLHPDFPRILPVYPVETPLTAEQAQELIQKIQPDLFWP